MFTIGDFARHGRVSVRMLRHYDALGLLRPARTDAGSGYRHYGAAQLSRLNRIVALKELGFTLHQVGLILDEELSPAELRGMLRMRRAELAEAVTAARGHLAQVEARLRSIESEGHMPTDEILVKSLPAVRVARLTATAPSFRPQDIGPVIGPLFDELCELLERAGVTPSGAGIASYEASETGGEGPRGPIAAHAAFPVPPGTPDDAGFALVDLPAVKRAAVLVHRGSMDTVLASEQLLTRWLDAGEQSVDGLVREVYLECSGEQDTWVTELQQPLRAG